MIRPQYFFLKSNQGLLAWDVRRLIRLSQDLPVQNIALTTISEIDEPHWYSEEGDTPTCRSLLQHMQLIEEADLAFPIILDHDGRVMDGMHRVCKAIRQGESRIKAVRFSKTPEPDFVDCDPKTLPYD